MATKVSTKRYLARRRRDIVSQATGVGRMRSQLAPHACVSASGEPSAATRASQLALHELASSKVPSAATSSTFMDEKKTGALPQPRWPQSGSASSIASA